MHQLRKRLTYANAMSTIAVVLSIGGASAFAASHLAKHSVGAKQLKANAVTTAKLKRNAVTEKKIRNNAITTAKIKDGAVTGDKLQAGTLGTVPNAATFSGYNRRGIVRVAASPAGADFEASRAASPEVPLFSAGAFSVYAKCFNLIGGDETVGVIYIRTSENGSIFDGSEDELGENSFLNTNTAETDRELAAEIGGLNSSGYLGVHSPEFTAMAPGGTVVRGDVQIAVKNGELPGGNGIYGAGNVCLFAGEMTLLNS
jgi:hypothetical protein